MRKQIIKNIIIIIALFFGSINFASAAPSISNTSGSFSNGQSVTISGSGFGTKSSAAPIKFDGFENGANGNNLYQTDASWPRYDTDETGLKYSNVLKHSGELSVENVITGTGGNFSTNFTSFTPTEEVFLSYWWRTANLTATQQNNTKLSRITSSSAAGGGGVYNGTGGTSLTTYMYWTEGSPGSPYLAYMVDSVSGEVLVPGDRYLTIPTNSWVKIDCHKKVSNPAGTANGAVECWAFDPSGSVAPNYVGSTSLVTRLEGDTWLQDTVLLGAMEGGGRGPYDYQIYIDDVYIDNTMARVEICDSATWSARMHCEVQPSTAWNTTAATITVNQGTFNSGSSQYLYIVDSNGDANVNGYAITFGSGSSDVTAPASPSGLAVN